MSNIFIDARFAGRQDGTGRVSYNLTKQIIALNKKDHRHRLIILMYKEDNFPEITDKSVTKIISNWAGKSTIRNIWDLLYLPYLLRKVHAEIYYAYEAFACPLFFNGKVILTIHDLIPIVIPHYWKKLLNRYWFFLRVWIATRSPHETVTVSAFSKKEIEEHFPILKGHIHVVYNALHEGFINDPFPKTTKDATILKSFHLQDKKYFLALGGLEKRKNNQLTINAFLEILKANKTDKDLVILGVGNIAYQKVQHADNFTIPSKFTSRIHFLPGVSDTVLKILLNHAFAFVYASTYEGFGIPMLEPMFYKTPVIALDETSIPEAGGDACLYVKNNSKSMKEAILLLQNDQNLYTNLAEKGKNQVNTFSWEKGARTILSLFNTSS